MNDQLSLPADEIHLWSAHLSLTAAQTAASLALLSADEYERARRFHFPMHRLRFIAARSILRQILSRYLLNQSPQSLVFAYTAHKKPYLALPSPTQLHFNLSHSHDWAIYAIGFNRALGIDIEKIQPVYKEAVAERFFHPDEYAELEQQAANVRHRTFYRLWSRKEALLKAMGHGLAHPLNHFSLAGAGEHQLTFNDDCFNVIDLSSEALKITDDYQAALASNRPLEKLVYWQFEPSK